MNDLGFPIIEYRRDQSPREWGRMHGEMYRTAIRALFEIRFDLMRDKNPSLSPAHIERLAEEQWWETGRFDTELTAELEGICDGSGLSPEHLVVVNNYTDFRDIQLSDEGCSLVFINYDSGPVAGQTWDMHGSAKDFVCCMLIPIPESDAQIVAFSLVGCLGMMGYTSAGTMVGVNNINTDGAVTGIIWPAIVRQTLRLPQQPEMVRNLTQAKVTSGHNYLVASSRKGEMWEVMPGLSECVGTLSTDRHGYLFHTNHCLGPRAMLREQAVAQNSTTHTRFDLLQKKTVNVRTLEEVYDLLNDHENYPRSICSNYQSGAQDPSITCGGAVGNLMTGQVEMWRGDPVHDANFKRYRFQLNIR